MPHKNKPLFGLRAVFASSLALTAGAGSAAFAAPIHDIDAKTAESGHGCMVRDANGEHHEDPNCEWHLEKHLDDHGQLVSFHYSDTGHIADADAHPEHDDHHESDEHGCHLTETLHYDGSYSSECVHGAQH